MARIVAPGEGIQPAFAIKSLCCKPGAAPLHVGAIQANATGIAAAQNRNARSFNLVTEATRRETEPPGLFLVSFPQPSD
jgi:hypothetical protein